MVGRKIRCKSCQGVFSLQRDGSVIAIDESPRTAPTEAAQLDGKLAASVAKAAARQDIEKLSQTWVAEASKRLEATREQRNKQGAVTQRHLTSRFDALRQSLASNLNAAAGAADKALDRKGSDASIPARPGAVRVVLSDEGRKQASVRRKTLFATLAVIALLIVASLFVGSTPPWQQALEAYATPRPAGPATDPLHSYRAQAWLLTRDGVHGITVLAELGRVHELARHTVDLAPIVTRLQQLTDGMRYHPGHALFAPPQCDIVIADIIATHHLQQDEDDTTQPIDLRGSLRERGFDSLTLSDLTAALDELLLPDPVDRALRLILAGSDQPDGGNTLRDGLLAGRLTGPLSVISVGGSDATMRRANGSIIAVEPLPDYSALLMRLGGEDQPWRVLDCWATGDLVVESTLDALPGDR